MNKTVINQILSTLDHSAERIESLAKSGKLDVKVASQLVHDIDSFADKLQISAYGKESFIRHVAKVIKRDPDEKYMDTFNNPNKVISEGTDQPYIHKTPSSFNSKGIDNFDQDQSSNVSDRDEYQIRDLNENAGGTKRQPSWPRGPAGKSTKQGSTKNWA